MPTVHALEFLDDAGSAAAAGKVPSVCALFGDSAFLKREAGRLLQSEAAGDEDGDELSLTTVAGRDASLRDVLDELSTISMFGGGRRMVVIEDADDFVSKQRPELEDYAARPHRHGVLVLQIAKAWPSNTKLYKIIGKHGLQVDCRSPKSAQLRPWLVQRAAQQHRAKLAPAAAERLLELIEPEVGLLDQELARLALLAGENGKITTDLVAQHVGSWRTRTAWELIDAASAGNAAGAVEHLDRLLLAGEAPVGILAQIASPLRRFAAATALIESAEAQGRRANLRTALEEAGFKKFVLGKAESQLRQIGRPRARQLYRWLLETDLALKGASSAPSRARLELEKLIVRLSRQADPR